MVGTPFRMWLWGGVTVFGLILAAYLWDDARFEALPEWARAVMGVTAIMATAVGAMVFLMMWQAFAGKARLLAGQDVIARWRITPDEWARFRAIDTPRSNSNEGYINDMYVREAIPPEGIEVIVAKRELLIDGGYHNIVPGSLPDFRGVFWLTADPECLEFYVVYPRGRYGGHYWRTLRIPVSPRARQAAIMVFEHYRSVAAPLQNRQALAFRYPKQTIGGGIAVIALFGVVALVGEAMQGRGDDNLADAVTIVGILGALGALVFTSVIAVVVRPWRKA